MHQSQIITIIVTLVCLAMVIQPILSIKWARESQTTTTIRPFRMIICAIVAVMGIYSLITGNYMW